MIALNIFEKKQEKYQLEQFFYIQKIISVLQTFLTMVIRFQKNKKIFALKNFVFAICLSSFNLIYKQFVIKSLFLYIIQLNGINSI